MGGQDAGNATAAEFQITLLIERSFAIQKHAFKPFLALLLIFTASFCFLEGLIILCGMVEVASPIPIKSFFGNYMAVLQWFGGGCFLVVLSVFQGAIVAGVGQFLETGSVHPWRCIGCSFLKVGTLSCLTVLATITQLFIIHLVYISIIIFVSYVFNSKFFMYYYFNIKNIYNSSIFYFVLYFDAIIFSCFFSILYPICVLEQNGLGSTLLRSLRLTSRYRFLLGGLFSIIYLIAVMLMFPIGMASLACYSLAGSIPAIIVFLVGGMVVLSFLTTVQTLVYFNLVLFQEGSALRTFE